MTPSAVAKLVERLRDIGDAIRPNNLIRGREIHQLADDFEHALATAPPEQRCKYCAALSNAAALASHDQKVRAETLREAARLISGTRTDDGTDRDEVLYWAASRIRLFAESGK